MQSALELFSQQYNHAVRTGLTFPMLPRPFAPKKCLLDILSESLGGKKDTAAGWFPLPDAVVGLLGWSSMSLEQLWGLDRLSEEAPLCDTNSLKIHA